jgi:hypothetical protein
MRMRSVFSHTAQAVAEGALIALLVVGLAAGTTFAGKGGGKPGGGGSTSGSTIAVQMVVDLNVDSAPNWDDQVTFAVSTTATDKPWVKLDCYQAGTWVSTSTAGFFPAYPWAPNFTLASGGWTGGAADCTATLYKVTSNGRSSTLATLSFHVNP